MTSNIRKLEHGEIREILARCDQRVIFDKTNVIPDDSELNKSLKEYVGYRKITSKSVLGLDIYQYSSYCEFEQTLIPFLFKKIFHSTIKLCLENHPFIFQKYSREIIEKHFISTGDGGFIIFDNPMHSLLFASNFAIVLRIYNAFHFYPRLRKIIGGMSVRYAITYDKIYQYANNFYGRAIINNARMIASDNLNRCLIGENVHSWFTTNMEGFENLQVITIDDIANIYEFSQDDYDKSLLNTTTDKLFGKEPSRREGIINSDILKIGNIKTKQTELNVYNLHLQVSLRLVNDDDPSQEKVVTVSLGNLNTSGI
ncbi:MAG: hypothetical protein U1C46_11950 [Bacteroidales bacterium]|nr:hypothetical protein [Bacteroidales bacterium]MDZ4205515.1 hypothetical protein [Bacteroidales bacterium]